MRHAARHSETIGHGVRSNLWTKHNVERQRAADGAAITDTYLLLLFILVHLKIVRSNLFWKLSSLIARVLSRRGRDAAALD